MCRAFMIPVKPFVTSSVQRLQETLAAEHQLPIDKQVLLISGGQSLDPHIRVCSYSAGTVSCPQWVGKTVGAGLSQIFLQPHTHLPQSQAVA